MTLREFRGQIQDALIELAEARNANAPETLPSGPSSVREELYILRAAASEIILCSSVHEAINRLKQDQLKLVVVEWLANAQRTDPEMESAIQRAVL